MSESQKVLIVDDEPRNQRIITEVLEGHFESKTANSGESALEMIDSYHPDLLLLDIMMPGLDGYEVCKRIRCRPDCRFTKVILVTGKAMLEERLKGYEVGADDYMTKPFVLEELLAKCHVFLRLAKVEKELAALNADLKTAVEDRTKKLVNAAKMAALGEMAGGIAHEINTPLGTIGLIGEQIRELASEPNVDRACVVEMTEVITDTVQRIGQIISGLRTFSRDGSRDGAESVPLCQIVEDTLTLCRESLKDAGVKLECEIPGGLRVLCRPVQISQVLLNLITNAKDAVQPLREKWIRLEARQDGALTEFAVVDSGSGISEEVRDKIFQPFFTTKGVGKGTGLGLSISKGIVDAHGGSIMIDPRAKNTRVVVRLPAQEKVA